MSLIMPFAASGNGPKSFHLGDAALALPLRRFLVSESIEDEIAKSHDRVVDARCVIGSRLVFTHVPSFIFRLTTFTYL
jgi:hypothetical protein